jgi:hypothetical protein
MNSRLAPASVLSQRHWSMSAWATEDAILETLTAQEGCTTARPRHTTVEHIHGTAVAVNRTTLASTTSYHWARTSSGVQNSLHISARA